MKAVFHSLRMIGSMGAALLLLNGCPSNSSQTTAHACEVDKDCPTGFNCVEKLCAESLTCAARTKGAQNPVRVATPKASGEECKNTAECAAGFYCDPYSNTCTATVASGAKCGTTEACPAGEYCNGGSCAKAGCEAAQFCKETPAKAGTAGSAECVTAGCLSSSQCTSGQVCIESVCSAPPSDAVTSCEVTNQGRTFASGASVAISAIAFKANGDVLPFQDFSVSVPDGDPYFTVSGKTLTAKESLGNGSTPVVVSFGSVQCPTVTFVHAGGLPEATYSRVVFYETAADGTPVPVSGLAAANFRFSTADGTTSAVDAFVEHEGGVYLMKPLNAGTYQALTLAADAFSPVTIVFAPEATADIVLPLDRVGETSGFGAKPDFSAFDQEFPSLAPANIALAYSGGSLPLSSLLNFSLELFTGDTAPKKLDQSILTSTGPCTIVGNDVAQTSGTFNIPRALYASVGTSKIGVNCDGIAVRAVPGRRLGWSIGTKLATTDAFAIVGPLLSSPGNLSVGTLLPVILPLFENFAMGNDSLGASSLLARKPLSLWEAYRVKSAADMQADTGNFPFVNTSPSRRLKFVTNFENPGIPQDTFPGATANDTMNAVITLVASISNAYGIVPLGVGAGIDNDLNGSFEPLSADDPARFPANKVHVRNAAPTAQVAEADVAAISVALNIADLAAATSKPGVRLKGLITRDKGKGIGWDTTAPKLGSFADSVKAVNFAGDATYAFNGTNNHLTFPQLGLTSDTATDPKVVVVRLSRAGGKRNWTVVVNPARVSGAPIVLPTDGFTGASENDVVCTGASCTDGAMSFSVTSLDVKNVSGSFNASFGPQSGKDLDLLAGDTKSFSIYTQELPRQ